ncbi:MAG: YggT family protein [Rhodobiaceae bacterium]|jgi:YggT family protein|nr:YggT family protein [Rhodobiaceae bacterium]
MVALLTLISQLIEFYIWIIIASAVLSWLVAFDVVNLRNRYVYLFADALNRLTEPAYRRIRRVLPNMGGLDLSPIVLVFGLMFLRNLMWEWLGPVARSGMGGY